MKKLVVIVVGMMLLAAPALALINRSKHDLPETYFSGNNTADEVCVFCHTPHGANTGFSGAPLWNRSNPGSLTGRYSSTTLNASISTDYTQIDAAACMGCHDGSTAMNAIINPPNTGLQGTYNTPLTGRATSLGLDMSNDHPVNFNYDLVSSSSGGSDGEIKHPTNATMLANFKVIGGANWMQCSNCHDVHNTPATADRLLVLNNAGSNLCFQCHIK